MSVSLALVQFPGETAEYRQKRNALLEAERDARRRLEHLAELRRQLPLGGEVPEDYVFEEGGGRKVHLSELFATGKDTLLLYNFMYSPQMEKPCPMCSSFLDGLNSQAPHIAQRINLAVVAKSPIDRILAFAQPRGWLALHLLSSAANSYNRDYLGETLRGDQNPMMNIFVRRGKKIHHFWGSELVFAPDEPGQNSRHLDLLWPLWNVLDLTPEGRGTDWFPRLSY